MPKFWFLLSVISCLLSSLNTNNSQYIALSFFPRTETTLKKRTPIETSIQYNTITLFKEGSAILVNLFVRTYQLKYFHETLSKISYLIWYFDLSNSDKESLY